VDDIYNIYMYINWMSLVSHMYMHIWMENMNKSTVSSKFPTMSPTRKNASKNVDPCRLGLHGPKNGPENQERAFLELIDIQNMEFYHRQQRQRKCPWLYSGGIAQVVDRVTQGRN
jgi:hypothetical protein